MKHLGSQEARKLLRIFRALQTSRVLHISMNARRRMNLLLIVKQFHEMISLKISIIWKVA